ncbi:MAG TPA: sigma factor-like helix-turn-helix DNA-binding protein, partial [Solirubrobacteraceae bacterium]|nr:sigma factor-like helix-turn-helix DNA-binding protein [Solirubrobacteraceae bacterium]
MSLETLAPDQRAVVQLVLQQERTYEELAGLLGISAVAVRDRAHRGLERLATPADDLEPADRARVADYLLGQLSVSARGEARALLAASPEAREWAQALADPLSTVARNPLPEIPEGSRAAVAPAEEHTEP